MGRSASLVDPSFSFLSKQPGIGDLTLLDSCNGLLLFGHIQDASTFCTPGYVVCNPATKHWVRVPNSGYPSVPFKRAYSDNDDARTSFVTYLIFDPVISSHFRLIELCRDSGARLVRIYSSRTERWCERLSERKRWRWGGEWDLLKTITSVRGSTVFHNMLHLIVSPFQVHS